VSLCVMSEVTTEADALRVAEAECVRLHLSWDRPKVIRGWRRWRVYTPGRRRGGNTVVYVSRKNGTVRVRRYER
jgi:hypothetical protein